MKDLNKERGQSILEYALIIILVAIPETMVILGFVVAVIILLGG